MAAGLVSPATARMAVATTGQWSRLLLALVVVFVLFHWSASALGSDRGRAGLHVALLVAGATIAVERAWSGHGLLAAVRAVGLGPPRSRGIVTAVAVCVGLWLVVPVFARAAGATLTLEPGWLVLVPGLFAQGGIAEETLFRGFLFGRLRQGRSFVRAAALSMLPFVAVHLLLFVTMPWPVALAALLLSVVLSFPMARLYELGGATIWAPALVHFVVQGTVKVVVLSGGAAATFPFVWMAASAVLPLAVLLIRDSEA